MKVQGYVILLRSLPIWVRTGQATVCPLDTDAVGTPEILCYFSSLLLSVGVPGLVPSRLHCCVLPNFIFNTVPFSAIGFWASSSASQHCTFPQVDWVTLVYSKKDILITDWWPHCHSLAVVPGYCTSALGCHKRTLYSCSVWWTISRDLQHLRMMASIIYYTV